MPSTEFLSDDDLHHLVLLYLAVAYETDNDFDLSEHQTVLRLIRQWMPTLTATETNDVVNTAFGTLQGEGAESPETLARAVGTALTPALRRRVLSDLGQVARADGFLSVKEAKVIRRVRAALAADSNERT